MENNIQFLLKHKHEIELLLLENNVKFEDFANDKSSVTESRPILSKESICDFLDEFENGRYVILNYQTDLKKDYFIDKYKPSDDVIDLLEENTHDIGEIYDVTDEEIVCANVLMPIKKSVTKLDHKDLSDINILNQNYKLSKIYKSDAKLVLKKVITVKDISEKDTVGATINGYIKTINELTDDKHIIKYMFDFSHIYKIQKYCDSGKILLDLQDVLNNKFSKLTEIKINQILDIESYKNRIINEYGSDIDDILKDIKKQYNIHDNFMVIIKEIIELCLRLYINKDNDKNTHELDGKLTALLPKEKIGDGIYAQITHKNLLIRHFKTHLHSDEEYDVKEKQQWSQMIMDMLKDRTLDDIFKLIPF